MSGFRCVLFDFGDTLFHRRGGHAAIREVAAQLGKDVDEATAARLWRQILARSGTPEEVAKGRDLSPEAHRAHWTELYRAADVVAEGMGELLYEREVDPDAWVPFPETRTVLEELGHRGVPVGVVSDTGWDLRPVLAASGLADLLGCVTLSYEHGATKPASRLFEAALAELGASAADTVMVGDNPFTDGGAVRTGLAALVLPAAAPGEVRGLDAVLGLVARL
ncbi:MAG TPA: HAD family hydrolase [Acidimicrobiales bacterium]|nr:HAD family hydrolase [Acidimicrobiales bacterium]